MALPKIIRARTAPGCLYERDSLKPYPLTDYIVIYGFEEERLSRTGCTVLSRFYIVDERTLLVTCRYLSERSTRKARWVLEETEGRWRVINPNRKEIREKVQAALTLEAIR